MASFPRAIFLAILASIVLAQPSPPAAGVQIGDLTNAEAGGWDVRFPLTVTQCEPVFIFVNTTTRDTTGITAEARPTSGFGPGPPSFGAIYFHSPDSVMLFSIGPLRSVGYVEWVCHIPAGHSLTVSFRPGIIFHQFTVQPGRSSSCLRNITATYSFASYYTSQFMSYTARLKVTSTFLRFGTLAAT